MANSNWGSASDLWPTVPAPFTPSGEDLELYRQACPPELLGDESAPRILVLGVTPALLAVPWPRRGEVHAVDYDEAMISSLWEPREGEQCHLARWQDMPFPDQHFDLVVGDCSFNALPGIGDYADVLREVARVRRPSAPMIARFFVQPEPRLNLSRLVDDAPGPLAHFRAAAKRLLVVMAAAEADGSMYQPNVPGRIRAEWGEVDEFLAALGQSPADIERAKITYGFDQRLNFPTELDIRQQFEPFFADIAFEYPSYDVGRHCPIVRFS